MSKEIPLTRGKVTIVEDADYEQLAIHKWHVTAQGYAARGTWTGKKKGVILMHRVILAAPNGVEVDHVNGNRLDNRRANLRLTDRLGNMRNSRGRGKTSRFKGVSYSPKTGKWHPQISVNGSNLHLGSFGSEAEAALVYNQAARLHFGDFARLNEIDPSELPAESTRSVPHRLEHPGIRWEADRIKWKVTVYGRNIGRFANLEDAIQARDAAQTRNDRNRTG